VDLLYEQHFLEVELVQIEHLAILRCLIRHHGLKRVFAENLAPEGLGAYREKIAVLKAMERDDMPELRKQLLQVKRLREGAEGERLETVKVMESKITGMIDGHKRRLLEVGAAGRLLVSGELEDVEPLEDRLAFEAASPVTPDGRVRPDPAKIAARNDAQVKRIVSKGGNAVVMLGGSHDLNASINRVAGGKIEYLRITTKWYRNLAD